MFVPRRTIPPVEASVVEPRPEAQRGTTATRRIPSLIKNHPTLSVRVIAGVALVISFLLVRHSYMQENDELRREVELARSQAQTPTPAREAPPAAPPVSIPTGVISPKTFTPDGSERDDAFFGPKNAAVVVMLFSDFTCERCKSFNLTVLPKLKTELADSNQVKIIYRDLPLEPEGLAEAAAQAAQCAGEQGHYWEAFELLSKSPFFSADDLKKLAAGIPQLDKTNLEQCMKSRRYKSEVARDREQALELGAKGAPSLVIGRKTGDQLRGVFIRGAQPYPVLKSEILRILEEQKSNAS